MEVQATKSVNAEVQATQPLGKPGNMKIGQTQLIAKVQPKVADYLLPRNHILTDPATVVVAAAVIVAVTPATSAAVVAASIVAASIVAAARTSAMSCSCLRIAPSLSAASVVRRAANASAVKTAATVLAPVLAAVANNRRK